VAIGERTRSAASVIVSNSWARSSMVSPRLVSLTGLGLHPRIGTLWGRWRTRDRGVLPVRYPAVRSRDPTQMPYRSATGLWKPFQRPPKRRPSTARRRTGQAQVRSLFGSIPVDEPTPWPASSHRRSRWGDFFHQVQVPSPTRKRTAAVMFVRREKRVLSRGAYQPARRRYRIDERC
jgi:hypothetical protein